MDGFESFLENEAGQDLPDLHLDDAPASDEPAADIVASTDEPAPAAAATEPEKPTEVAAADAPAAATAVVATSPDDDKLLEGISGGRLKGKGELQAILAKADQADALQAKITEWEKKYGDNPYADSYEETRNLLKKQGATETQLKELDEITKLGELKDLEPLDIKVKAMVMRDGIRRDVAERIIKEQFGITEFMSEDAKEISDAKLKISAKEDLKYLEDFKERLKPVDNSTVALQREAAITQAKEALKPVSAEIQKLFTEVKDFNITGGKKPEDTVNYSLKVPEDFQQAIPELMDRYIVDRGLPINSETIASATEYVENLLWAKNGKEFLQSAVNHAISVTTEKLVNKYENRSTQTDDVRSAVVTEDEDAFYREVAGMR